MFVCLDKSPGTMVASDSKISNEHYLECDGKEIRKADYPELFEHLGIPDDRMRLPDMHAAYPIFKDQVYFYIRARA